jgi:hypothetical protein
MPCPSKKAMSAQSPAPSAAAVIDLLSFSLCSSVIKKYPMIKRRIITGVMKENN